MADKLKYSTDAFNRLVINEYGKRYPVEGVFKIEKNNLSFLPHSKAIFTKQLNLPSRIRFDGKWALTQDYDLKFVLIETKNQLQGDELYIRGNIVSFEAAAITFGAQFKRSMTEDEISLLKLRGCWQADEFNQLQFAVTRAYSDDIIKLEGGWRLNENQQITYSYQKQDLARKTKTEQSVAFKGHWGINTKDRLACILDLKNKSFFEFRARVERPLFTGKEGEVRYALGIGVKHLLRQNIISLSGTWRVNRQKSVTFEMDYGKDGVHQIVFGATVYLERGNKVVFELKNKRNEALGFAVTFEKKFFRRNASVFARILRLEKDNRIEAGVRIRW